MATEPGLLSCRSHASHFLAIGANFVARGDSGTLPALVLTAASRPPGQGLGLEQDHGEQDREARSIPPTTDPLHSDNGPCG